jgi:regulatory protein YycI of two-component signal transduction system YycFG
MIQRIYIITLLVLTVFFVYLYFNDWNEHQKEFDRISNIEKNYEEEQKRINELRAKTTECSIKGLESPRICYVGSNYTCKWNTDTKRCEQL